MNVLQHLRSAIENFLRSSLILCVNTPYAAIIGPLLLSTCALAASLQERATVILISLYTAAALSWGIFIAAQVLQTFFKRATHQLEKEAKTAVVSTGLRPLDAILHLHKRSHDRLLETIQTISTEAEELLERYEILTGNLVAGVTIHDPAGKIVYASPYCEVLTGYPLDTICKDPGDFLLSIINSEDRERYQRAMGISLCGEPFQLRYRFLHSAGFEMWAETRTVPILSKQQEVEGVLSITFDVTGTVRYQRQVEEQNRDLKEFGYMVSHDLKAPINTIQGMIRALQDEIPQPHTPETDELLTHIESAAVRLRTLVHAILEYAKTNDTQHTEEPVPLKEILDAVIEDHASAIQATKANIALPQTLPIVKGDRRKIYQIFSNLVGNALKYHPQGSVPQITIRADEMTGALRRTTIHVIDAGIGIPTEKLQSIFKPFQRINPNHTEGAGIGLACVKRLVDRLDGQITVSSEPEKGSDFSVTLPLT
jgi:PAS domain S-box-containing protein